MADAVALITGTSRGIGRHLAARFLERGWRVAGCSRGGATLPPSDAYAHFQLDVTDEPAVVRMFQEVRRRFGRLDHLVNNAGVASMNHFMLTPPRTVQQLLGTNFLAPLLFSREAVKLMRSQQRGRIVNFTTVAVPLRLAGELAYASSKAALMTATQIMAKEVAGLGITVNAVGPTPVETDLIRGVAKDKIQKLLDQQALPRLGTCDDVLNVIDFFLRPESSFVTGQIIHLGGVMS
jgi:3-oxoacyl-[acyl-carrier protein] reductase